MEIEWQQRNQSNPVPVILEDGKTYPLHSLFAPQKEGERLFSDLEINKKYYTLLFCIGFGGGFHLQTLEPLIKKNQIKLVLIEEKNLSKIINQNKNIDQLEIRKKIEQNQTLLDERTLDKTYKIITEADHYAKSQGIELKIEIRFLNGYLKWNKTFCTNIRNILKQSIQLYAQDKAVFKKFSKRWIANLIRLKKNADKYKKIPNFNFPNLSQKKVLITAAGPSLERELKNLPASKLRELQIIATDTSLPLLVQKGILPKYVITIDCQHHSIMHHKAAQINKKTKEITLIRDIFTPPILDKFYKKTLIIIPPHPAFLEFCKKKAVSLPIYQTGGNVTFSAISTAIQSGAKEIDLIGADFMQKDRFLLEKSSHRNLTIEKTPYCRESAYQKKFQTVENKVNKTEGNLFALTQNKKIEEQLKKYKDSLEKQYHLNIQSQKGGRYLIKADPLLNLPRNNKNTEEKNRIIIKQITTKEMVNALFN